MQERTELIGILQSISIVAKRLAERLVKIEEDVKGHEAVAAGNATNI